MSINNRMNVLLLTPDRVGSTLLQRVLTIYMLRQGFDKPVINLHELTNGLEKYINPTLNQEVLGKPRGTDWGYYQSLEEITELLKSVDHYKTSRLAHYHIERRKDSIADQIKFYEYLNKDFYVISCRRKNLLEHALSWIINDHSKHLNIYDLKEKFQVFDDIYKNGIIASKERLISHLDRYKKYINWSDTYFGIQSYFNYEDSINNLEEYILNLDFMKNTPENSWHEMFGIEFDTWNQTHKVVSELPFHHGTENITPLLLDKGHWDAIKDPSWREDIYYEPTINNIKESHIKNDLHILGNLQTYQTSKEIINFLDQNLKIYKKTSQSINDLITNGFLVTGIPIKLQTFNEKKKIIKNFDQCIKWYNEWVNANNFGEEYNEECTHASLEEQKLNQFGNYLTHKISGS